MFCTKLIREISMDKRKDLFESAPVGKAVWTLALPTIASMLVTVFYNLADTFFVGQTGDKSQVAAVSLVMPLFLILMAFGNLYGIGGGSAISRFIGAKKYDDVKHVSSFCFYGSIVTGIILGAVSLLFMSQIVPLTGATESTYQYIEDYITIIAIGAPFIIMSAAFGNIVRSDGSALNAMIGMMIGTVVNIVLDPIMILVLGMGVKGAALATIIGNIAATVFYIILLFKPSNSLSLRIKDFKFSGHIASNVYSIGVPACLNNILMAIASIIYNVFLTDYGDAPVAAMGIAMKVSMLTVMMLMGLTMGAQPIIGYNYGSGNVTRLKKVTRYTMITGIIIGVVISTFFLVFAQPIVTVFIDDAEVIMYGTKMLRIQASTGTLLGIMFVSMSTLQAMGKAVASLLLSICRQGLAFIPAAIIANKLFQLDGLIWAQPIADMFSIILSAVLLSVVLYKQVEQKETLAA